ncbi:glycoside hydrolase family 97 protein [Pontibacter sp. G13]|uniref:glycoside hydrolase family 97 protein n=1 Tax=Pontibacter sp. G13 TaxID=3074898 RepID=UPI00288AC2D6|nr:glycoside hydrolase family 97 protein [Pontibacter sp. G13]WNJ20173.1 glycoside hydrolase family 97 protein [Pontibacter sp. G13]
MNSMNPTRFIWAIFVGLGLLAGCQSAPQEMDLRAQSPSGNLKLEVFLTDAGQPAYTLAKGSEVILDTSTLGFEFLGAEPLGTDLVSTGSAKESVDETWDMPWGEQAKVRNHFEQLRVSFQEQKAPKRKFDVVFKVYDDGLGFRYEFPKQAGFETAEITEERTQFNLTGDHEVWWQPGDWDSYEHLYNRSKFSEVDAISKRDHPNIAATYVHTNAFNTPVTMKTEAGTYLSFHEANLTDYSGMTLVLDQNNFSMESGIVGGPNPYKVKRDLPFNTPWRMVQVADRAGDLIESRLVNNLNEPDKLGDVSWFTPMKYVGVWWEMHLGTKAWELASGKHGATTANAKRHIDFAAENNIGGILIEGWNTGWERWFGIPDREGVFDFITPYPDYDFDEVARYAKEKGVQIIMHHETSAAPRTYEQQLDTAYALMQKHGIHAVKTGYVGPLIPEGEYHHGQWMVNHYRKVILHAAEYEVAVNAHEPIKATGLRRTYPNIISREGLRGQEYNAWASDGGNMPDHLPTVAFTRMLAGPIDYTPGIFNLTMEPFKGDENNINTTLGQQLALYVVIYSPIQMVPDLPEHYAGHPALQFIRDVAVDWDATKVLNGEPGDFVTIARKQKGSDNWFIGSITGYDAKTLTFPLDFLDKGKAYEAIIYEDAKDAHWKENPTAYNIRKQEVDANTVMELNLAPGGGTAVSIMPK